MSDLKADATAALEREARRLFMTDALNFSAKAHARGVLVAKAEHAGILTAREAQVIVEAAWEASGLP